MIIPVELTGYIIKYGYLAIFSLVFIQEIGVPNPVPNELILLFSGYLAYIGTLNFFGVFFAVVSADFIGTTLLYIVFYFIGEQLIKRFPRLFSKSNIEKLTKRVSKGGVWGIYVGRLLPYVRGYTSVAAGLLEVSPRVYLPAVLLSAITWSGGYVIAGRILGKRWEMLAAKLSLSRGSLVALALVVLIAVLIGHRIYTRRSSSHPRDEG